MGHIVLLEHERVIIADGRSSGTGQSIMPSEVKFIAALNKHHRIRGLVEPFEVSSGYVKAKQFVGVVSLGKNSLEVLPKIEHPYSTDGADIIRGNLFKMLQATRTLKISSSALGSTKLYKAGILEAYFRLYCTTLASALRRGLIRAYQPRSDLMPTLKGKWALTRQLRLSPAHSHKFECDFDELTIDNPHNRMLKRALKLALENSRSNETQALARQLLLAFDEVDAELSENLLDLPRSRLTAPFDDCIDLAELFLKNTSPDVSTGKATKFSTFFDMNILFEEYFARRLSLVLPGRVLIQKPVQSIAIESSSHNVIKLTSRVIANADQKRVE
ncbi:MAG: hypothetical protein EOP06_16180 [Proteobacteria bacterium]|nr:MAG: hypothetical protein EOP06_16180 [Pseudomonadota bacterium]